MLDAGEFWELAENVGLHKFSPIDALGSDKLREMRSLVRFKDFCAEAMP
jgi:hypothetical protein